MDLAPLDDLWTFAPDRVYLFIAIARSKDNPTIRATDQPTMRKVVEAREEVEQKAEQLRHATARFDHDYRLYATVNGRNTRDALFFLLGETHDWLRKSDMGDGAVRSNFKRVDHEWKSILHQPRCRDQKRFLFDVDESRAAPADVLAKELLHHTEILLRRQSPNGWHIVTEPFNFNEIETSVEYEYKPDDMVFLDFL